MLPACLRPLGTFQLAFWCVGFAASSALAGPNEEVMQVAVAPNDPDMIVLRYENSGDGLLYSRDGGESFALMCGSSVADPEGRPLTKLGPMVIGGDGKVLLGVFGGLYTDDGTGCSWQREPSVTKWVSDLAQHPTEPGVTLAITSLGGEMNGLLRRDSDGNVEEVGTKLEMLLNRLRVVALPEGGGVRVYISAIDGQVVVEDAGVSDSGLPPQTAPNYVMLHSDDLGETWTRHEIGVLDGTMRLEAVDPTNPDRILINIARDRDLVTNQPLPDTLRISEDRGETFTDWHELMAFGGIAIADDGEVFLGERGDNFTVDAPKGIYKAEELGAELTPLLSDVAVRCLHLQGDELWMCQKFAFGTVSREDGTFTPKLQLTKVPELISCDGVEMEAVCRQQMCTGFCGSAHFPVAPMCVESYGSTIEGCAPIVVGGAGGAGGTGGAPSDASVPSGGGGGSEDAGEPVAKDGDSGCGACSVGARRAESTHPAMYGALFGLLLCVYRARARRRSV